MATDLYKELGVSKGASADEIKKVYKKLASQLHPDKNPGDQKIEARFKAVNRAYQVLNDPEKRRLYDEFGEESLREGFNAAAARAYRNAAQAAGARRARGGGVHFEDLGGAGAGGFGDLLGELFGGGGRSSRRGNAVGAKGSDVASEVAIDFVSAIRGAELRLRLQDGGDEVTVRVPPGAGEGDKVRVAGHGAPSMMGGPPGDLVISVRVNPHPYFERDGLDLYLNLPITVAEAHRGAKVRVPTPDGPVTLSVPKHAQSGQELRLKGKGVKRGQKQGDLYVRFLVKLPAQDSPEIEAAVATLESAMSGDVRGGIHF
ncbi:MAG TPA: DnaJ C-terminal domain-containing protein [Polyangiaceae bacterium]|nr:DnaJ C-terminal domain-containing protein [Polyangiaceae bacterium]